MQLKSTNGKGPTPSSTASSSRTAVNRVGTAGSAQDGWIHTIMGDIKPVPGVTDHVKPVPDLTKDVKAASSVTDNVKPVP